jgi:4-oxalomesaconate hydratase
VEGRGPDLDNVKAIRHAEATKATAALGAELMARDFGDYPLDVDAARLSTIVDEIRDFAPDVLITHTDTDPFNPDHPVAHAVVARLRSPAAGVARALASITSPRLFLLEPRQPERCTFTPTTFARAARGCRPQVVAER